MAPSPIGRSVTKPLPQTIGHYRAALGEGPLWDHRHSRLIWCDILGGALLVSDWGNGDVRALPFPDGVTSIGLAQGGHYIATSHRRFVILDAQFRPVWQSEDIEPDLPNNRFNDGKVDPLGRFWAGTMEKACKGQDGSFYLLDEAGVHTLGGEFGCTNGPAFSPDNQWAVFTDSNERAIYRSPLTTDQELDRTAPFIEFGEGEGAPDGMTFDVSGRLYVGHFGGHKVSRFLPDGTFDRAFELPAENITSVTFGGADFATLFATSAHCTFSVAQLQQRPDEGAMFAINPGAKGQAEPIFRIPQGMIHE